MMKNHTSEITLTINNVNRTLLVGQDESLLDALRKASYFSVKRGCDDGTCGICTVLLNGKPVHSCKIKAVDAKEKAITTVEGLSQDGELHPTQRAFVEAGAIQCGFCTPAQVLAAKALLDREPNPTEDQIRKALNGVLCRCTGYVRP
ncbi:MAG: (2Fe-2S)-binding protein, partial [Anaerolineales bacterium]